MLAAIELNYQSRDKIEKLPDDLYAQLRSFAKHLPEKRGEHIYLGSAFIVGPDALEFLAENEIHFDVKQFKNNYKAGTVQDAIGNSFETHVHIPNIGLLAINEVDWLENACTDELQGRLDAGWSIIAVCPPNAQRRPDYILGRTKSERTIK